MVGDEAWPARKNSVTKSPKSAAAPVHDSMTHNDQGHAYGSPEAIKDFTSKFGKPSDYAGEPRSFRSGMQEINRLKRQGK